MRNRGIPGYGWLALLWIIIALAILLSINSCGTADQFVVEQKIDSTCRWEPITAYLQLPDGCSTYTLNCRNGQANCVLVDCGDEVTSACK